MWKTVKYYYRCVWCYDRNFTLARQTHFCTIIPIVGTHFLDILGKNKPWATKITVNASFPKPLPVFFFRNGTENGVGMYIFAHFRFIHPLFCTKEGIMLLKYKTVEYVCPLLVAQAYQLPFYNSVVVKLYPTYSVKKWQQERLFIGSIREGKREKWAK